MKRTFCAMEQECYVVEAVRVWPEYAALHGMPLSAPSLGGKTYQPATHALERRWKIFAAKHGCN